MYDRGGLTCQRCVKVTEVESMSEAERKKRGSVCMTEEYYRVRGGTRKCRSDRGVLSCQRRLHVAGLAGNQQERCTGARRAE